MSSLAVGASVALYDGSPLVPTPDVLWNLVDQLGYVHTCVCVFLIVIKVSRQH